MIIDILFNHPMLGFIRNKYHQTCLRGYLYIPKSMSIKGSLISPINE